MYKPRAAVQVAEGPREETGVGPVFSHGQWATIQRVFLEGLQSLLQPLSRGLFRKLDTKPFRSYWKGAAHIEARCCSVTVRSARRRSERGAGESAPAPPGHLRDDNDSVFGQMRCRGLLKYEPTWYILISSQIPPTSCITNYDAVLDRCLNLQSNICLYLLSYCFYFTLFSHKLQMPVGAQVQEVFQLITPTIW